MTIDTNPIRGRAFRGSGAEERAHRAGLHLRASIYQDERAVIECERLGLRVKAAIDGVNSAGGFLVADELEQEIMSLRDAAGVYRRNATSITIGRESRRWPKRSTGLGANPTAEGGTVTESTAGFDQLNFVAKKFAGLVRLSSEVYEDETVSLAAWIAEELAFAFADQEDAAGFAGDGTSTYNGISGFTKIANDGNHNAGKSTAAGGHNTFGGLDGADFGALVGKLPAFAAPGAAFYTSMAGFGNSFWRLAMTNGAVEMTTDLNGRAVYLFMGIPIVVTPKLPTSTSSLTTLPMLFLGDLRLGGAIATRRGVTIRRSDDRYLDSDQIAVLGTERVDIISHGFGDNTTAGPLVSLVAP